MPEELRSMIEREAMRLIDERRKAQKITVDDLARRLYPEKGLPAARMMIQRLRSAQGASPLARWIWASMWSLPKP